MHIDELQYDLPTELIAREPADRRDASRLLVLDRATGAVSHEPFARSPMLLPADALMVLNDTKVIPARLEMRRQTGGRTEGLFLHEGSPGTWEIMLTGSGRLKPGEELLIDGSDRRLRLRSRIDATTWQAEPIPGGDVLDILSEIGHPPLPPYVRHARQEDDPDRWSSADAEERDIERYQTLFAREPGAVAAPTAGLHFTPEVFAELDACGIDRMFVTLHVGAGTFLPIRCDNLAEHDIHSEWYDCPPATADAINTAREEKRPVVAVGTTSVRVLETCGDDSGHVTPGRGDTKLFIYPPYRYKVVDHLVTNFHLPGSTLLAMIFAFAGRDRVLAAYNKAIEQRYRFYSYGDAMLIL